MSDKSSNLVNFPFIEGFKYPFKVIFDNAKNFISLSALLSFYTCFLFYSFYVFSCWGQEVCVPSTKIFIAISLFFAFGVAVFIDLWQKIAFSGEKVDSIKKIFSLKDSLRVFYFILFVVFLFSVIFGGIYYLNERVVTADFEKELAVFAIVSLLVFLCVYTVFCLELFVPYYNKSNKFYVSRTILSVIDNIYKLFGWFMGYLFIIYVIITVLNSIILVYLPQVIVNFVTLIVVYFVISVWISMLNYQYSFINKEDK